MPAKAIIKAISASRLLDDVGLFMGAVVRMDVMAGVLQYPKAPVYDANIMINSHNRAIKLYFDIRLLY